jgi:putative ABC transport system substrate-binding protein
MNRRDFLALVGAATLSLPRVVPGALAQQAPGDKRVLFLWNVPADDPTAVPRMRVFQMALEQAGWTAGSNFRLDVRYDAGNPQTAAAYADEIPKMPPDVIVAVSFPVTAFVAATTSTVPIVQIGGTDPVAQGLVASLAHPDGNITGFPGFVSTLGEKWFELLLDIAPATKTVGYLYYPAVTPPIYHGYLDSIQAAARVRGVTVAEYAVTTDAEIDAAMADLAMRDEPALLVQPDNFMAAHRAEVIVSVTRARLPNVNGYEPFANEGGMASYAANTANLYVRAAGYTDALLRGETVANLPIQPPAVLDLVINTKAARAMGISIPPGVLLRAARTID